jgi:hypothetical protein
VVLHIFFDYGPANLVAALTDFFQLRRTSGSADVLELVMFFVRLFLDFLINREFLRPEAVGVLTHGEARLEHTTLFRRSIERRQPV